MHKRWPSYIHTKTAHKPRWAAWAPLAAAALVACGGGGGDGSGSSDNGSATPPVSSCQETGPYACKTGATEPLYTFQWALNYAKSWFTDNADAGAYGGGIDLNVEPVHQQGIKGQGVNVLVIDSGVDLGHEDLSANADYTMSWNFETNAHDPSPLLTGDRDAHGTHVAGMIGAAQNGQGVMGIAPLAKIGAAAIITDNNNIQTLQNWTNAYGGAAWSSKAHVINASYGLDTEAQPYDPAYSTELPGLRNLKSLRGGKGIVFIKAAGNAFSDTDDQTGESLCTNALSGYFDCTNPANDPSTLEPNVITTAALNAKGQSSYYSSAGSVVWITGFGGEQAAGGRYGEQSSLSAADIAAGRTGDGPTIFSTDIRGCTEGYSQTSGGLQLNLFTRGLTELVAGTKDNPNCAYGTMNGTSSATPTITGVVALMLSANPDLTWRDVRDILRLSARPIDIGYEQRVRNDLLVQKTLPYNARFDLRSNTLTAESSSAADIQDGAHLVPLELGWTTNAAGLQHSNWYGFGVPDAAKAVELAQLYKKEPARSRSATQTLPPFQSLTPTPLTEFTYQRVSLLAQFAVSEQTVDQFQVRLSGENICLGSMGIAVKSPAGTVSLLKMPLDHFHHQGDDAFTLYGLGSYAFYGEQAKGTWQVYALASNPNLNTGPTECDAAPADGIHAQNATLSIEARVIAQ